MTGGASGVFLETPARLGEEICGESRAVLDRPNPGIVSGRSQTGPYRVRRRWAAAAASCSSTGTVSSKERQASVMLWP